VIVEFSVALLVATNTSASAVTKERESQTLDLLLVTPITSRYYIWGKLRGLVSFMLPFAAVPTLTMLLVVLYDWGALVITGKSTEWVVWPETIFTLPLLLTAMLAWACMLGLQLSLKWARTIVAVMASVGVLLGICSILGVCGFAAVDKLSPAAPVVGAFSPFTAICMLIAPKEFATSAFGPAGWYSDTSTSAGAPEWAGRIVLVISILLAATAYCLIIWGMYRSMVKNFDMIIRRQHQ
jgi:ABC-type transport system involved in multi-copper enzyme maturation permease subunit